MRTTNNNIMELKDNQIFVFGSNLSGFHGAGAAKTAIDKFGAVLYKPHGLQGKSYAIPTKDKSVRNTLPIEEIKIYVDQFIEFAKQNQQLEFLVTEIGCGLAGLKPFEIAPLFINAVELKNVHLPEKFWNYINNK